MKSIDLRPETEEQLEQFKSKLAGLAMNATVLMVKMSQIPTSDIKWTPEQIELSKEINENIADSIEVHELIVALLEDEAAYRNTGNGPMGESGVEQLADLYIRIAELKHNRDKMVEVYEQLVVVRNKGIAAGREE